jgi:hypothetical protein
MPVQIQTKQYLDVFGTYLTYYKANAGDEQDIEFTLTESISVQSSNSVLLNLDPVNDVVTWVGGDFQDEGFRVGDSVVFTKYDSTGAVITTILTSVTAVAGDQLDVVSIPFWYDFTVGEIMSIFVRGRAREGCRLNINHVQNGTTGNAFSLIDGEVTTFLFDLLLVSPVTGIQVGKSSGQFAIRATLNLTAVTPTVRDYTLTLKVVQSGIYSQAPFNFANSLKLYVQMNWQSLVGEPYANLATIISDDSNNGWFDEAFNLELIDASLVQPINYIAYDVPTSGQFVVDSASLNYGFGSCYISDDEAYYKNRYYTQSEIGMLIPTSIPTGPAFISSLNEFGAGYDFLITGITTVGTIQTIDFTFTPNANFVTFMQARPETDRLFYVWARYGNVNLLVYQDQLITQPAVGGPLILQNSDYFDHSENVITGSGIEVGYNANVEDDLAFFGNFRIPFNALCTNFTAKIESFNSLTNEAFTLQSVTFLIANIPQVAGKYIIGLTAPVFNQFQTTSEKRIAILELDPSNDTITEYGVKIYFPFLYRWEYWLPQINADADFFPNNQTRNWVPYGNQYPWSLKLNLQLIQENLAFNYIDSLRIFDYDSDPNVFQTIELYIDSTNQNVGVVVQGGLMRVVATHELLDGSSWANNVWGQITVEPTESAPRWWCSTAVNFDGNLQNPLSPLSGLLMAITYPTPSIARMECFFDPSKINLQNGCKFTTKIKACTSPFSLLGKQMTTGGTKQMTTGGIKQIT